MWVGLYDSKGAGADVGEGGWAKEEICAARTHTLAEKGVRPMKWICVRLSPARLLAGVAAALCLLLGWDAVGQATAQPQPTLATPQAMALWLKDRGVEVDPAPVWEKTLWLPDPPDAATEEYLAALEAAGYQPRAHSGRPLRLSCFRVVGREGLYARVLTDAGALVGADGAQASPAAPASLPLAALAGR